MINRGIIILGAPGSGKGTATKNVCQKTGFRSIETGELVRRKIGNDRVFARKNSRIVEEGRLISDDAILSLVEDEVTSLRGDYNVPGIVFDGFPRSGPQASALKDIFYLASDDLWELYVNDLACIELRVSPDTCKCRIQNDSGRKNRGDNEVVDKRLKVFNDHLLQIRNTLEMVHRIPYRVVSGDQDPEDVCKTILDILGFKEASMVA